MDNWTPFTGGSLFIKRTFDLVSAGLVLILTSPLLLASMLVVKLSSAGPVFFLQTRVGRHGREFSIIKFRTMRQEAGSAITIGEDRRITWAGRMLRLSKLDELPQLINVIRGEMSVVGPRPEVPHYVSLWNSEQRLVLSLRPGMTDRAALKYRYESDLLAKSDDPERTYIEEIMPDKLQLNLEYLDRQSFWYDIGLILRTLARIFSSS